MISLHVWSYYSSKQLVNYTRTSSKSMKTYSVVNKNNQVFIEWFLKKLFNIIHTQKLTKKDFTVLKCQTVMKITHNELDFRVILREKVVSDSGICFYIQKNFKECNIQRSSYLGLTYYYSEKKTIG